MFDQSEINTAHEAAEVGMRRAIEHAERLDDTFPERAEAFIYTYARSHYEFTGEALTAAGERAGVIPLNGGRAWGAAIKRAASRDISVIRFSGRYAPRIKGHGAAGPIWQSLVYQEAA